MSDDNKPVSDDKALFENAIGHVKKLKQSTVFHQPIKSTPKRVYENKRQLEENQCAFYFSDAYHPLVEYNPIRYRRNDVSPNEIKKLRRSVYEPELFLDLHGLTQKKAKQEIAALITACLREHTYCACIIYGHGKNILKKQTPMWLAQHPNVLCFHQAPKAYGGLAALFLLIDTESTDGNRPKKKLP